VRKNQTPFSPEKVLKKRQNRIGILYFFEKGRDSKLNYREKGETIMAKKLCD